MAHYKKIASLEAKEPKKKKPMRNFAPGKIILLTRSQKKETRRKMHTQEEK